MSVAKYSNFERSGSKQALLIADSVAAKTGMDPSVFTLPTEHFIMFLNQTLDGNENVELSASTTSSTDTNLERLVRTISDYILDSILSGTLKPGDKLASDRDLALQFDVGRTIIREALKVISVLGLIDIRPGQGTFICQSSTNFFLLPLSWGFFIGEQNVNDIIEVRNVLEIQSAQLAAKKATDEHILMMKKVIEQSRIAVQNKDIKEFLDCDIDFHLIIAQASQNKIVHNLLTTSRNLIKHISKSGIYTEEHMGIIHNEHEMIYKAISHKDGYDASQFMLTHLINSSSRYKINKSE